MEPPSSPLDGGRLPSIIVYLGCLSVLAHVFGAHVNLEAVWLIATGKRALVWSQLCSNAVFFLSWILVFFSGTLSSHGFGEPQSTAGCSVHVISMLTFYCAIKIFLHCFLVDRGYTVWTAGSPDANRLRSRLWLGGMLSIIVYPGLLVLNIFGRTSAIDDAGQCLIGFAVSSTAPTLAWGVLLTVAFVLIFASPLRRTTPAQTSNPMIRTISYRTLIMSLVAFLAGTVNIALFIGLGQQQAWIYGISTVLDLTITSFALHRISNDAALLAAAEVRRGSLSHALGLPLRDVGLGGEVFLPSLPLASPGLMSHGSEDDHERYYPAGFNVPRSPTKTTSNTTKDKQKAAEPSANKDKDKCGGGGGMPKMECVAVAGDMLPSVTRVVTGDKEAQRRSWKEWIFPSASPSVPHWPPIPLPASVLQGSASASAPLPRPGSISPIPETDVGANADLQCVGRRGSIAPWEDQPEQPAPVPSWQKRLRQPSFGSRPSTGATIKPSALAQPRTSTSSRNSTTTPPRPSTTQSQGPPTPTATGPNSGNRLRSNSSSSTVGNLNAPRTWSCSPIIFSRSRRSRIGNGPSGLGDDYSEIDLDLDSDFASLTPSLEEEFGPRGRSMSFGAESTGAVGGRKMSLPGAAVALMEGEGGAEKQSTNVDREKDEAKSGTECERIASMERSNDWSYRTFSKVDVVPPASTIP